MNRLINFRKAFGLIALLGCWVWTANAQSSKGLIFGASCIPAGSGGHIYSINLGQYPGYTVQSSQWSVAGGISLVGSNTSSATISSSNGTTYGSNFSKYGKGRVSVEAVLTKSTPVQIPCGPNGQYSVTCYNTHTIELEDHFDICKIFSIPDGSIDNWIVGPQCVATGEEVTYSIAPWITMMQPDEVGYDEYEWFDGSIPSFVQNGVLYYSADKSSVTFIVGQLTGNDIISVQVGRCNHPNNVLTLPLRKAIPTPIITPSSCVAGGVHNETFTIQNQVSGVIYTWSSDNWTRISSSNVGTSMTYQTDNTGAANIRVDANYISGSGCQSVFSTTQVTRTFGANSKIVTQSGSNCLEANEPVKFIIQNAPTPAIFNWSYNNLTDWTFSGVEATTNGDEITLIPGANAVSGETLRVSLNGCNNDFRDFQFNMKPGDANPITSSTNSFCINRNGTYTFSTTATSPNPSSYLWDLGEGWTIMSTAPDGLSITAQATGNTIGDSIRVTPKGLNGCDGKSKAVAVSYPPTAPTGINVPDPASCINSGMTDNIILSVIGGSANQKYTWELNGLGTITNGATSSSINVQTLGTDGSYTVSVSAYTNNDVCSQSASISNTVTISGVDFSVREEVLSATQAYYVMTPNGWSNRSYSILWELDGSDETFDGNSYETNEIYSGLLDSSSPHDFRVTVTRTSDQCKTRRSWGVNATPQSNSLRSFSFQSAFQNPRNSKAVALRTSQTANNATMTIAPNPTNELVQIAFSNAGNTDIQIRDMAGRIVKILNSATQIISVDVSNFAQGSYAVLATQNGINFKEILIVK